jgi:Cation efflux family
VATAPTSRRAAQGPDEKHPLGFGRESYVWSMSAALGLFAAGSAVSVAHGISQLLHPEPASDFLIAYIVLAIAVGVLLGEEATGRLREGAIAALTALPQISRITFLRLEYVGPRQVYSIAAVDLIGDEREHNVAVTLRHLEEQLETHPAVVQAVLTLSADDEASITG